ncbi:MAG TPA: hypothetical protein PKZ76_14240 [Xanthomonadaceae bacterium]|nr:hypothetical protein [Xanthomonadaceae bacterium]
MRIRILTTCALVLSLCATGLRADDALPPAWQLGPALEAYDNHDGPKMTGEHLRRCEQLDYDGRRVEKIMNERKGAFAAVGRRLDRIDADLDRRRATLDNRDGPAVDAFNRVVAEQQQLVDEFNARLPAFNEAVHEYNELVDRFNEDCVGRAYMQREWWELRMQRDR